jgi:hypothetical protein
VAVPEARKGAELLPECGAHLGDEQMPSARHLVSRDHEVDHHLGAVTAADRRAHGTAEQGAASADEMELEPRQVGLVVAKRDDRDQPPPQEPVGILVAEEVAGGSAHGDDPIGVVGGAGAAVALMLALYTASFAAGAIATQTLEDPGNGVGEAALVISNTADLARSAPSLALLLAAWAARRHLPKAVSVVVVILAATFVLPITSWLAALATPVWLGVAGAFARTDGAGQAP